MPLKKLKFTVSHYHFDPIVPDVHLTAQKLFWNVNFPKLFWKLFLKIVLKTKLLSVWYSTPRKMTLCLPVITFKNTWLKVVKDVKYKGFHKDSCFCDNVDIRHQTRAGCVVNELHFKYFCCLKQVKNIEKYK